MFERTSGHFGRSRLAATLLLTAASAAVSFAPAASAQDGADAAAYRDGYQLILDENWSGARRAFEQLVSTYPQSDWADDAAFWLCYAKEQSGEAAERAFECYQGFAQGSPESEWVDDAERHLVRLARELAATGKPEYRDRVRGLEREGGQEKLATLLMALAEIGDERSLDVIFERLDRTRDEHQRAVIVQVLGDVEGPAAEKAVAKLTELARTDPSTHVRAAAVMTLSDFDELPGTESFLRELVSDAGQPAEVRAAALYELEDLESPDLAAFLEKLILGEGDPSLARAAIHTLGEIEGEASLAALNRVFEKSTSRETREAILAAAADRDDPGAVDLLHRVIRDASDPELARRAVWHLGEVESDTALASLAELARSDREWRLRATAIAALGEVQSEAAVQELMAIGRESGDPRLRRAAAFALAETELDAAVQPLVALAGDSDPEVRRAAAHALGELGTEAAREALIRLLEQDQGD